MNLDTAQQVIQKQAMQIANLTLQNTVAEVELEQTKTELRKLQQGAQRGTEGTAGDE